MAAREQEARHPSTEYKRCIAALSEFRDGCEAKVTAERRALSKAEGYHDPGDISLCPPPTA